MPALIEQPNGAPTRKVFGSAIAALGLVILNQTLPALFPALTDNEALSPLYEQLLVWAPLIVAAAGYQIKEWGAT